LDLLEWLRFILGPFFGVLLAFAIERGYGRYRDRANRKKVKTNLKSELEKCKCLLTGQGNLLPTEMWNSTITTGDTKLLSFDERGKLSSVYFEINKHNYEAKRVRDSSVVAQTGPHHTIHDGKPAAEAYWTKLSQRLRQQEDSLRQRIAKVLAEPWWDK